jgi:hypothetical protein
MIHDHPLTGIGLDQFLSNYSIEYVQPQAWSERFISHPHNLIFDFWLRLGILGPIVLVWLLFSFYQVALSLRKRTKTKNTNTATSTTTEISASLAANPSVAGANKVDISNWRVLALALFGSMVDFAAHGLVDNSYFLIDLAIIFCVEVALLEVLRREIKATKEQQ